MTTLKQCFATVCGIIVLAHFAIAAAPPADVEPDDDGNFPEILLADGSLRTDFREEIQVLTGGLQPSLLCTKTGALIVQAQVPHKPYPSKRMVYPSAMETRISRDDGKTWKAFAFKRGENGINMEGGATQLRDGTIIGLDTYIVPAPEPNRGFGQLYISTNDWQTLDGPHDVPFEIPNADFYCSKDDGGHPHDAHRLHRRIIELPNGDLLTTFYGWLKGDRTPATYMPTMMKSRVMLARSHDHGWHWQTVSTVASGDVGTEGFDEPVLARISQSPKAGRLICIMRTGRELRQTFSDDEGATWSPNKPLVFAGLDIYRTEEWVDQFRKFKDSKGRLLDEKNPEELRGAVVDPDLIELRSGILVAAFGVRIPQKACWAHPEHPWNGNYVAVSTDHGETWPNVIRMTSGKLTTHYMAIAETATDNRVFITYDMGSWTKGKPRDIRGRFVTITQRKKTASH